MNININKTNIKDNTKNELENGLKTPLDEFNIKDNIDKDFVDITLTKLLKDGVINEKQFNILAEDD